MILTKVERTQTLSDVGFVCKDDVLGEMAEKVEMKIIIFSLNPL